MIYLQIAANGLVLGGLYACIAVGFSLVWGVLNVINILHGSFIVLGSYVAYFAYVHLGIHPFISIVIAGGVLYALGYLVQVGIMGAPDSTGTYVYPDGYRPWSTPILVDTKRRGQGHGGHERQFASLSDDECRELIEFLKRF